jgi:hypothetical protein
MNKKLTEFVYEYNPGCSEDFKTITKKEGTVLLCSHCGTLAFFDMDGKCIQCGWIWEKEK